MAWMDAFHSRKERGSRGEEVGQHFFLLLLMQPVPVYHGWMGYGWEGRGETYSG